MTTVEHPVRGGPDVRDAVSLWHEVDDGFWVANSRGVFLGTIERTQDERYGARGATYTEVGRFPALADAQAAVAGFNG